MGNITTYSQTSQVRRQPVGQHFQEYLDCAGPVALAALNELDLSAKFMRIIAAEVVSQGEVSGGATQYQVQAVVRDSAPQKVQLRFQTIAGVAIANGTDLSGCLFRLRVTGI